MAVPISILFPTRGRREYLDAALASVAPQARVHGAEIVVLHDAARESAVAAVAARHGARYVAMGAERGINVARNAAIDAAGGELLCLLDDDVEAWPGWLDALAAGAAGNPGHDVFGGPIRPRLEGALLRSCGREAPPVTALDLGPEDRDAELVWGANLALRRRALERAGRFDPARSGIGDEEDWLRRLREQGGRVRYLAGAGVDHRRARADATRGALARAGWQRGRQARAYDLRKGSAPGLAGELRRTLGPALHALRARCDGGWILAATNAGRLAEALWPTGAGDAPARGADDFLSGEAGSLSRLDRVGSVALDLAADVVLLPRRVALGRAARQTPGRRVMVMSVARPEYAGAAAAAGRELERSHHEVAIRLAAPLPGAGKWENLNAALAMHPPHGCDWLLLVDDDVRLPRGFLDAFVFAAERFGFRLAQPAHAYNSHAAWRVTRRRPGALARRTRFVEIGPVTALHASTFDTLLPFPDLRMGWGLDAHWAALADAHGWPIGIVDATPIHHTRPVAASYPHAEAIAEARAFLAERPYVARDVAQRTVEVFRSWR